MPRFQRAKQTLTADIEDFIAVSDKRMLALARQSTQDVINNAQTAVKKGGRMRVDTGFLRASGQASYNGMPQGPVRGDKKEPNSYSPDEGNITAKIGEMKIGQTFYFGWTANYARFREVYDGFLEGAVQHWGRIVAYNTDTIRQRIKK